MNEGQHWFRQKRWQDAAWRCAEYGIAVGVAVLCGYGIVLWRW